MKKINQAKLTLFDSTMACFRLNVEAMFTRRRPDGSDANLLYITDKGSAHINPSIYLVFTYRGETYETTKNLYMSYPQLFQLRENMTKIKDMLVDKKGFNDIKGTLDVAPENQDALVMSEIGKGNKWLSFNLAVIDSATDRNELSEKIPGVTIQISDSDYASVLTAEEFLTIYTIVMDLDLTIMQTTLSMLSLIANDSEQEPASGGYKSGYQKPQYQAQQQSYQPQYQQKQTYNQNNQNSSYQPRQQQPTQAKYGNAPVRQQSSYQQQPQQNQQQNQQTPPVRREEKTMVNMKNVEQTAVAKVNFADDAQTIEDIFND